MITRISVGTRLQVKNSHSKSFLLQEIKHRSSPYQQAFIGKSPSQQYSVVLVRVHFFLCEFHSSITFRVD